MGLIFYLISFAIINCDYLVCAVTQPKHEVRVRNNIDESLQLSHQLESRADAISPAQFGGQVSWTAMTSGDGTESGNDKDGIWYLSDAIQLYLKRVNKEQRTGVFWAGGATTEDDFETVYEFLEINLNDNGRIAEQVFPFSDFERMNLDGNNKSNLWWRAINRMSKALAAGATNGVAYVYLKNNNCRTLFSPPSQNPQDNDPTSNGQATNGEIFYYAELPMLMRNMNIQQIKTFSKVNRKYVVNTEWDVNVDLDKPRDFLPDIAMDATPIVLPQAAGRPPLKRDVLPSISATAQLSSQGTSPPYASSGFSSTLSTGTAFSSIYTISSSNRTTLLKSINRSIAVSLSSSSAASSIFVNPPDSSAYIHMILSGTGPLSVPRDIASTGIGVNVGTTGLGSLSSKIGTILSPSSVPTSSLTTFRVSRSSLPSTFASQTALPGTVPTASQSAIGSSQRTSTQDSSSASQGPSSSVTTSTTLNPTGAMARISAHALQSQIIAIGPKIQSYINKPSIEAAQDAINALKGTLPKAQEFSASIGPGSSPKPCGVSTNPISDIFNAATCLTKSINDAVLDIEPGLDDDFSNIDKVTSDLSDLNDLQKPLESDSEDDDEPSQSQNSQTPSSTKLSTTSATSTGSRSQSCSHFQTVSDCYVSCPSSASCSTTCYSTSAGCSATGITSTVSESAAACAFNPASDFLSQTIPLAAFITTAWWDYGISCAGSCTDFTLPPSSVSSNGDLTVSLVSSFSGQSATTGPSMTSNPAIATMTSVHDNSSVGSSVQSSSAGALPTRTALKSSITQAFTSASVDSVKSVTAQSAATITQNPICVPDQNTGSGNGGVENCLEATFCECSSGNNAGTYVTMSTGSNLCGYTIYPPSSLTWNPSDQVCTLGLSASASSASAVNPAPVVTKGQIIYTSTQLPTSGAGTTLLGCTSTTTGPGFAGFESTACVGSITPLTTIFPPVKTPTGDPVPPTCNKACDPQDASCQGDPNGYVPNPVFFEAAIGVVCGPACSAGDSCYSFTDRTLVAGGTESLVSSFECSTLQTAPGGNSSLDCEPKDWEHNPPPYWLASGISINLGVKLLDTSCQWKIDSDTCMKYLSNSLTGCPAGGIDSVECVAWTVGAGAAGLSVGDWAKQKIST